MIRTKAACFTRNGMTISVQECADRKLPKLCVEFKGENRIYDIAVFRDKKTAQWFIELMAEEFLTGDYEEASDAP